MSGRGRYMTVEIIQRTICLLATTEMAVCEIAERMGCSKAAVVAINRRFQVRRYNGKRAQWIIQGTASDEDRERTLQALAKKQSAA